MDSIIQCRGLTKMYNNNPALLDLNLSLPKGKIIGLLGPNGSGKTTFIKLAAGLILPDRGEIRIMGNNPGKETKAVVSYLPERPYFDSWMKVSELLDFFEDFYADFDRNTALGMLSNLGISTEAKLKTLSKGTKEKVQLILVMSRRASVYLLDEPIGGVDPAARDYILRTIVSNYNPEATVIISTHLIADIEKVLDEFIFIGYGRLLMYGSVDELREKENKSLDEFFREVFRC